jgi:hypothetical protein
MQIIGKTNILHIVTREEYNQDGYHEHFKLIQKLASRPARDIREKMGKSVEVLPGQSEEVMKQCKYRYPDPESNGEYGINTDAIDEALMEGKNPILSCSNTKILVELCKQYEGRVCPILVIRQKKRFDEDERKLLTDSEGKRLLILNRMYKNVWGNLKDLFGHRYIVYGNEIGAQFFKKWFQLIMDENGVIVGEPKKDNMTGNMIEYFRKDWRYRPELLVNIGDEPIIPTPDVLENTEEDIEVFARRILFKDIENLGEER